MDDMITFIASVQAYVNACEDYKRLDATSDREAMQAESLTYEGIRDELRKFKEKLGGSYDNKNN
ncbi:MAG: hypothetical protein J6R32_02465 [Bacteroidales bacterium]|nr:hypothetical protein [Bacteroidales bacterium]